MWELPRIRKENSNSFPFLDRQKGQLIIAGIAN